MLKKLDIEIDKEGTEIDKEDTGIDQEATEIDKEVEKLLRQFWGKKRLETGLLSFAYIV